MDYGSELIGLPGNFGAKGLSYAAPLNKSAENRQSAFDNLAMARLKEQLDANKASWADYLSLLPGMANVASGVQLSMMRR